jgi:putative endonuclease
MSEYYVYIMTNKGHSTLYVGVTNSLVRRVSQHRAAEVDGFTCRYNLSRLVYFGRFNDIRDAIAREKQLKGWRREKKVALIERDNPAWADLGETILGLGPAPARGWHKAEGWNKGDPSLRSG